MIQELLNQIGNTPLVKLKYSPNPKVVLAAKLEGNNPGGSVKDRAAYNMLTQALIRKDISEGDTVIEATSGNTGIALALMASVLKLKMKLVMPENATPERVKVMRAYGAEVILTNADAGIEGSRDYAEELSNKHNFYTLNQFANKDNWKAHYKTTGPEIWKQSEKQITHFVSAMGTTGTITGTSTFLKEQNSKINIVGVQPQDGASIPGIRKWPKEYLPKIFDPSKIDRTIEVSESDAFNGARELAKKEGVFAGISSGGAYSAALKLASELNEGLIVFIACDRGDKYLSTDLF